MTVVDCKGMLPPTYATVLKLHMTQVCLHATCPTSCKEAARVLFVCEGLVLLHA